MKNMYTLLLTIILALALCACDSDTPKSKDKNNRTPVTTIEAIPEDANPVKEPAPIEPESMILDSRGNYIGSYICEERNTNITAQGLCYNSAQQSYCIDNGDGTYTFYAQDWTPYTLEISNVENYWVTKDCFAFIISRQDGQLRIHIAFYQNSDQQWVPFYQDAPLSVLIGADDMYYRDVAGASVTEYDNIQQLFVTLDGVLYVCIDHTAYRFGYTNNAKFTVRKPEGIVYLSVVSCSEKIQNVSQLLSYSGSTLFYIGQNENEITVDDRYETHTIPMPRGVQAEDIRTIEYTPTRDVAYMFLRNGEVYTALGLTGGEAQWRLDVELTNVVSGTEIVHTQIAIRYQIVVTDREYYLFLKTADGTDLWVQSQT